MLLQYDKQDQVERNLDILEGKDPEASRQKKPLQPSLRQNETMPSPDDTSGHTKTQGSNDSCPPLSVTPLDTPVKVQAPNGSEENDPLGAAIPMDTSPDGPVRPRCCKNVSLVHLTKNLNGVHRGVRSTGPR